MGLDINAILFLTSIPLFIIGLILLIIQAAKKKKKKISILIIVVSVLMCASGICLPDADEMALISSSISEQNKGGKKLSKELAETFAKQEIVDLCCDYSSVSSVSITYGTFNVSEYHLGGYEIEAQGTYLPIDDYGMYGKRMKFHIELSIDNNTKKNIHKKDISYAY